MATMSELLELFIISNTAKTKGWTLLAYASDAGNMEWMAELLDSMDVHVEITACAATVRFRRTIETVEDSEEWIGTVCCGDMVRQGEFSLTRRDHDDSSDGDTTSSLHSALLEKPWSGIVLDNPRTEGYQTHNTYMLVIREQGQKQSVLSTHTYWERIGLLKLENCTLEGDMLERQTWRLA